MSQSRPAPRTPVQLLGLTAGAAIFVLMLLTGPPDGVAVAAWRCGAVAALMVIWWATEALPLGATSLLPIVLLPLLGLGKLDPVTREYASPMMFLLLGAALVALGVERSALHRRIAFHVLAAAGGEPRRIVLGIMVAAAFISMWVSNLATALMMLPVALGLAACAERPGADERDVRHFTYCLILGVGYAATIGGMSTVVGTPTNAMVAGIIAQRTGTPVTFASWASFGVPMALVLVPAGWLLLTRGVFRFELGADPKLREAMLTEMRPAGRMTTAEKRVAAVFTVLAFSWTLGPLWRAWPPLASLTDAGLAIVAAVVLFMIPSGGGERGTILGAADLRRVPWEVLLLLGGSLALSDAMDSSGLSRYIVDRLQMLTAMPYPMLVLTIVAIVIAWTEVATNASAAATVAPALIAVAAAAGVAPVLLLLPAALAASCGYALPIGTPANTAVYASGRVPIGEFVRAGLRMDVIALIVITLGAVLIMPLVF
ncbi:MAG: DASS family sodium-coupled anion symporter [Steroidobacteraceae bacterium]